jgi:hypothetical protein
VARKKSAKIQPVAACPAKVSSFADVPKNSGLGVCPVCSSRLPEPASTGRPRLFCSPVCTERARGRRRKAAALLEYAGRQAELAEGARKGTVFAMGSAEYLDGRAADLRGMAEELLCGL